ncbi:translationally-controlled tumor protein [Mantella aurantiaca]
MIIYRDVISGDEMFSDIYKMKEVCNGLCFEVEGKTISRREGEIDDALIGGNASAECLDEGAEGTTVTGVDIVINHKLQETGFSKDSFKQYIKDYMKSIKCYLEKNKPDRVKPFMSGASEKVKELLGNFKNLQFYTGETMNPEAMVCFLDYREDGITPFITFFKDGLEVEKC